MDTAYLPEVKAFYRLKLDFRLMGLQLKDALSYFSQVWSGALNNSKRVTENLTILKITLLRV